MRKAAFFLVFLGLSAAAALLSEGGGDAKDQKVANLSMCAPVSGISSPQDIRLDSKRRLAFIAALGGQGDGARGAIHVFSLDDPLAQGSWRDRTNGVPAEFVPRGIDYFENGNVRRIFAINAVTRAIEIFDLNDDGDLAHAETISERRLTSPNSIVATGPRSFYVTNDVRAGRNSMVGKLTYFTKAATGEVFSHNDDQWRVAASGLRFANGIAALDDGNRIAVAESAAKAVRIYNRNVDTNFLTLDRTHNLSATPDNLTVDERGAIWISAKSGLVPNLLSHLPQSIVPFGHGLPSTQIIRLGTDGQIDIVFGDDAQAISNSSVAARAGDQLVIGSPVDEKFLLCELDRLAASKSGAAPSDP